MEKDDILELCSISLFTFVFFYTVLFYVWEPGVDALIVSLSLSSVPLLLLCFLLCIEGYKGNTKYSRRICTPPWGYPTGRVNYYTKPIIQSPYPERIIQNYKDSLTISEALDIVDKKVGGRN